MRYLLTLNIIQKACLAGGDVDRPAWFFICEIARLLRRGLIRLYMIKNDHIQALVFLQNPIFREDLERSPRLLRDLIFITNHVSVIEDSREIVERARLLKISASDAMRITAAVMLNADGIISMEPQDFVYYYPDREELGRYGRCDALVDRNENIESGEEDEIRMLVMAPYAFIESIPDEIKQAIGYPRIDREDDLEEANQFSESIIDVTQVAVVDWQLSTGQSSERNIFIELENQFGNRTFYEQVSFSGEIDAMFMAINECVQQFIPLPRFHLHYTVTSAQGIPGPVKIEVGLMYLNRIFMGTESGDSTIDCTVRAYIQALNKVLRYSGCSEWDNNP